MRSITIGTFAGPFTTILRDDDVVLAAGFTTDADELLPQPVRSGRAPGIAAALRDYLHGDATALEGIEVEQPGTPVLQALWRALRNVPAGDTVTYGALAASIGRPRAARIAGEACRRNLAPLFVPCHRVVPATGGVGRYRYGPAVKTALLDLERQSVSRALASPAV